MKSSTKLLALGALGAVGVLAAVGMARAKVIPTTQVQERPLICEEGSEKKEICISPESEDYNRSVAVQRCVNNRWMTVPKPISWCWAPPKEEPKLYTTCARIRYPSGAERDVCQTGTLGQIKCKYTTDPATGVVLRTCIKIGS